MVIALRYLLGIIAAGVLVATPAFIFGNYQWPWESSATPAPAAMTEPLAADTLRITIDGVVHSETMVSKDEAMELCEETAYNTDHMWKTIVCTYNDEELYNDVFVAG